MSMYGEDGSTGYDKENLYCDLAEFLENHMLFELLEILSDVVKSKEVK